MGKLDPNTLYDALKHESLKDHVELDEEDHEFLSQVSKGEWIFFIEFLLKHCLSPKQRAGNKVMFNVSFFLLSNFSDELREMIQKFSENEDETEDENQDEDMSQDENEDSKMLDENDEDLKSPEEQEENQAQKDG